MRRGIRLLLGMVAVVALVVGAAVATLVTESEEEETCCATCGLHQSILRTRTLLGWREVRHESAGAIHGIIRDLVGPHQHQWIAPAMPVFSGDGNPSAAVSVGFAAARQELNDLVALDQDPAAITLLSEAAHRDP